jgi:fumarate reductase subunit C
MQYSVNTEIPWSVSPNIGPILITIFESSAINTLWNNNLFIIDTYRSYILRTTTLILQVFNFFSLIGEIHEIDENHITFRTGVRYSATPKAVPFILFITSSIAIVYKLDFHDKIMRKKFGVLVTSCQISVPGRTWCNSNILTWEDRGELFKNRGKARER